ncbi:hypothetical protein H7F33_08815 [Pedobacter sp. PAMC26386]|nr:hypothetical protein H7F33_08815 [Pedobacter sp. PAMC26386]
MRNSFLIVFTVSLVLFSNLSFGQTPQLKEIENKIKKDAIGGKFEKQVVDLNNDGKNDIIYLYQCGEPKCIKVLLNIEGVYKEQVAEQCNSYAIRKINNQKLIYLTLTHCCGESPYVSKRVFEFNKTSASLKENYVLTNDEYTGNIALLMPLVYSENSVYVKVIADNYNLRFSPSIQKLEKEVKNTFVFGVEEGTNIIAKIKLGSTLKVLSELIEKDRTWLFVEVEKNTIGEKNSPIDFDFKGQKLRGWISDKYVTKAVKL